MSRSHNVGSGLFWADDQQVCLLGARRLYAAPGEAERTVIRARHLEDG